MDPDGTICYLINLTISFILCLYSGAKLKMEQDEDFPLGVSPSQVSAVMLMLANIWAMATYALPTFKFPLNRAQQHPGTDSDAAGTYNFRPVQTER